MAELDKQKEKIAFFRSLFFFLLASIFALVAFVFTKYQGLSFVQLLLADIAGFALLVAIVAVAAKLKDEIDKIGEM